MAELQQRCEAVAVEHLHESLSYMQQALELSSQYANSGEPPYLILCIIGFSLCATPTLIQVLHASDA